MRRDKQQARCAEISTQRTMRNKAMARMTTRACRTAGSTELPRCYAGKGVKGRDAFNAVCGSSADATRLAQDGDPIRLCPLLDECRTELGFLQAPSSKLAMRSHASFNVQRSTLSAGATARCRRDAFNAVCGNSADAMRLARDGDPIRLCPLSDECRTQLGFLQAAHAIACVTLCATAMHAQSSRLVTTPLLRYPTPSPSPRPQPPQCDGPATNRRAPYCPVFCGLRVEMAHDRVWRRLSNP